ncbi:hypothetical protein B0H12DRAFT_1221478 [Mycena haematopus]|nr:hypothetical protein B0H12DRAFT_1221478 [Mycena haematopus]
MSDPTMLIELQADIVELCRQDQAANTATYGHRRCVQFGPYFIKYGGCREIESQYKTHLYFLKCAVTNVDAPRLPKVHGCFNDRYWAYLVMENIPLQPTLGADAPERIAKALQWLRDCPAPPSLTVGPVGGGYICHEVFGPDYEAPLKFSSTEAIERYLNKARKVIPSGGRPAPVSFQGEPLVFVQSDMDARNFPDDMHGNTCMLDCEGVARLPSAFADSPMRSSPFARAVAQRLNWPASPNAYSMSRIQGMLVMLGGGALGRFSQAQKSNKLALSTKVSTNGTSTLRAEFYNEIGDVLWRLAHLQAVDVSQFHNLAARNFQL